MKIGEIERVGEREIPMPTFKAQHAPAEPAPSSPEPQREHEPSEPENVR
jgi:hypothetical protein